MRRDRIRWIPDEDAASTASAGIPTRPKRVLEELEGARSQLVAGQCNKRYYAATPRSRPPAIHRPKSDLCGQLCADVHVVPKTVGDIKVRPAAGREATSSSARFSETGFANEYPLPSSLPPCPLPLPSPASPRGEAADRRRSVNDARQVAAQCPTHYPGIIRNARAKSSRRPHDFLPCSRIDNSNSNARIYLDD